MSDFATRLADSLELDSEERADFISRARAIISTRTRAATAVKSCRTCQTIQPVTNFALRADSSDGRQHTCRQCDRIRHKALK